MNRTDTAAPARIAVPRAASITIAMPRVAFLDHIRYLMVLLVVVYHAVAAYARVAPPCGGRSAWRWRWHTS